MRVRAHGAACAASAWALVAALAGCGGGDAKDGSQVVASVGRSEITESQVSLALEHQRGLRPDQVDAVSRRVVTGLVEQQLVIDKARDLKLDRDQRVMQNIESMKRELIAAAYVNRIAEGARAPGDRDIQAYYDDNPALFAQRRIYTLQELALGVPPERTKEIEAQLGQLKSTQEIAEYLKAHGISAASTQSTVAAESLPLPVLQRVSTLKPGQGLMIASDGKLRVLLLLSAHDGPLTPAQARPSITAYLLTRNKRQAVEKELASLHAGAQVAYYGKYAGLAASAASSPSPSAKPVVVGLSQAAASAPPDRPQ